jgi:hypothetical protein
MKKNIMRLAAGATPDANGRAVDFNHLKRRKHIRLDIQNTSTR